jgi:diguanylate cyclase (GGDEF)-like protein
MDTEGNAWLHLSTGLQRTGASPIADPALRRQWHARQVEIVIEAAPRLAGLLAVLAPALVWLGAPALGTARALAWAGALLTALAALVLDTRRLAGQDTATRGRAAARWRLVGHGIVLATLMAGLTVTAFPPLPRDRQLLTGVLIGAALCAGAIEMAAIPPMALAWIAVLGTGSLAALQSAGLSPGSGPGLVLMLAGALMLASVLGVSRTLRRRVHDQTLAQQAQAEIGRLLQDFETQSDAWSWGTDRHGRLGLVAPRMAQELGHGSDVEALRGQDLAQVLRFGEGGASLSMRQGFRDAIRTRASTELLRLMEALRGDTPFRDIEIEVRSTHRPPRWWSLSGAPVHDARGAHVGWRGLVRDITTLRAQSRELERLALVDSLTGLANRHVFQQRARTAVAPLVRRAALAGDDADSPLALYLLDLDNFKAVNDRFGHQAGDRLLQAVAQRLRACVEAHDIGAGGVLARLGGDEFALLVTAPTHVVEREALALALLTTLREPWQDDGLCVEVRASLGVSAWHGPEDSAARLLQQADIALYEAKAAGRDTVRLFDAAMGERMAGRHLVIHELGQALAVAQRVLERPDLPHADGPCGRLSVHYQPQHDIIDGRLTGFEALVRWRHPQRGWISPAQFVPVAEETGLVIALGAWVLRQACRDATRWPGDIKIAVNVSGVQLTSRQMVRTVAGALNETGLPPARLELEVTETAVLADPALARARMLSLRALGVRLGLDDFGTGYSSLAYLRTYPIDTLKIDRSFVTGLADGEQADMILGTIIRLGRGLGMTTLAEGVETAEQRETLRRHGCQQVQGYLHGAAMPVQEATRHADRTRRAVTAPEMHESRPA